MKKIMFVFAVSMFLFSIVANAESGCVKVFVVTLSPEGFTATKQVADSTKDFIKSLKKKDGICITENQNEAAVTLEVLGREKAQMTASWLGTSRDCTVAVKLTAGTYETTLQESAAGGTIMSGGAWGKAAGKVAKLVEQWVKENRKLLEN